MWNSSRILLALTLCFTAELAVYCQYDVSKYPFDVNEDEVQVEKLVIEYTRRLPKPKTKFGEIVDRVVDVVSELTCPTDIDCDLDQFESFRIEDVHDQTKRTKLLMCKAILRLNYFGLQFDFHRSEDIPSNPYKISLRYQPIHKLGTHELRMFQCPPLKYVDLATDEPVFLSVRFFISNTHKPQSFFLYAQEDPTLPIYPHKFASGVYFSILPGLLRHHLPTDERPDQLDAGSMNLIRSPETTDKYVSERIEIIKSAKMYEKFQKFYKNQVICGMLFSYKIALCRYIAQEMELKLDSKGFFESKCQKRNVFSNPGRLDDETHFIGAPQTVKCPAFYESGENGNRFISRTIFLTSSHRDSSGAFILQRLNLPRQQIKPEAFTHHIRLQMLEKERRRIREYEYLKPDSSRTQAPISESIRRQFRKMLETPTFINFDRALIENKIISFVQMKQQRNPYLRFSQSFNSISVNMWLKEEIDYLCHMILTDEPYNLDFETEITEYDDRLEVEAELTRRDAELLPNKKLRARQCSLGFKSSSTLFIVGTIHTDAVIVCVKYENEYYVLPHSYVSNLHRDEIRLRVGQPNLSLSLE